MPISPNCSRNRWVSLLPSTAKTLNNTTFPLSLPFLGKLVHCHFAVVKQKQNHNEDTGKTKVMQQVAQGHVALDPRVRHTA